MWRPIATTRCFDTTSDPLLSSSSTPNFNTEPRCIGVGIKTIRSGPPSHERVQINVQKSGAFSSMWVGDQHENTITRVEPLGP